MKLTYICPMCGQEKEVAQTYGVNTYGAIFDDSIETAETIMVEEIEILKSSHNSLMAKLEDAEARISRMEHTMESARWAAKYSKIGI